MLSTLYDRAIISDSVALTPGTKLGPYEIQSLLGAGGMGDVYRARDTRLERTVAVKVLPESLAGDADRLRRFAQEARVLSALNHPNLLSIYDVGAEGEIRYLVSEFLEGGTLRECLGNAPLPRRRSVDYALQIANGLAAAHDHGIVHRDLKPENIFVTRDQRIKILDFGLAKQAFTAASAVDVPTLTGAPSTQAGVVLGTIGYMSPEQVRGKAADHRSDIFSFGATLYEMVSGRRAFSGESSIETMNAILKEDPPELNESSPTVSPGMDRIIRRCLEKAPERRFQSASDLAFAVETLPESSSTKRVAGIAPAFSIFRSRAAWIVAASILTLTVVAFIAGRRLIATNGSGSRFATGPVLHRLTFRRGTVWNARFAPDGNSVIYGAAWEGKPVEIFESRTDLAEARALGITGADVLAISDKGRWPSLYGDGTVPRDSASTEHWRVCH